MEKKSRETEMVSRITAFSNGTCSKAEYLPELLKLQNEVVELVMGDKRDVNEPPRLWNAERYLRNMNAERGNIATAELDRFSTKNKAIINDIKAEISGKRGEEKVFRELNELKYQNSVLRNVELEFDGQRAEIDAIVFTRRAAFIIEIKNSLKNIYIDKNGEFIREGERRTFSEGNILFKMNMRENLLRRALEWTGLENIKIYKIVVFTNTKIEITNDLCYGLKTMYSNRLANYIDSFQSDEWYSSEKIVAITAAVNELKCREGYKMSVDMADYKRSLAELMAKLESDETPEIVVENVESEECICLNTPIVKRKPFLHTIGKYSLTAAVFVGIAVVNVALFGNDKLFK